MHPKIRAGQTWQHFKGGLYLIVEVEHYYPERFKDGDLIYEHDGKSWYAASDIFEGDSVVEYESEKCGDQAFLRSVENFLELLPDGTPRFTLLEKNQ